MPEHEGYEKNPHVEEARQHFKAAHKAMHEVVESMLPEGMMEKRRAARKEMLLAFRSMLDAALERIDKK